MNWLSYLGVGFSVLSAIVNILIIIAVKFNDLKHVQKDLDEIKKKQTTTDEKLDKLSERVANIEGKLQ
jgi:septal ring factor EnvC (AmiA/AmiB activator)